MPARLIQSGNGKLGSRIGVCSLLARIGCRVMTPECKWCYGDDNAFRMPHVQAAHRRNYEASLRPDFEDRMVREINRVRKPYPMVRPLDTGDVYSVEFGNKLLRIVRRCPATKFCIYTKAWADAELLPVLIELAHEPNVRMYASFSRSAPPRKIEGMYSCYFMVDDDDRPPVRVDLVFRFHAHKGSRHRERRGEKLTPMLFTTNRSFVCPHESGVVKTTCSECTYCWTGQVRVPFYQPLQKGTRP